MPYSLIDNIILTLALLVARFIANDANHSLALDDFTIAANPLN